MNYEIIFSYFINSIFAMGWGSFATMAVYRLANNEPWIGRRPFCPSCKHNLSFIDYISIISYFLHGGKCRYCKAEYEYRNIYFATELLILIYFTVSFYFNKFDEIYILNAGIIISAVIYSVIYFTTQKSSGKMLIMLFFCVCLKRVYLDNTIYDFFYGALLLSLFAVLIRYLYFFISGNLKEASDFLEFKPEDRFANNSFVPVKIAFICGAMLGATHINLEAVLILSSAFFIFPKLKYSVAIFVNMIVIFSIFI